MQVKRRSTGVYRAGPKTNVYGEVSPPVQPGGAAVCVTVTVYVWSGIGLPLKFV